MKTKYVRGEEYRKTGRKFYDRADDLQKFVTEAPSLIRKYRVFGD
jgi:hypothetical protein